MTTNDRDDARLPEFGAGKPVESVSMSESTLGTIGRVIAPHGSENPSRSIAGALATIARVTRHAAGAHGITLSTDDPRRIAELETQLAEERAKVAALSQPRVFSLSGVVEADLAERYESLRSENEALRLERDQALTRAEEWANEAGKARKEREDFRVSGFVLEDNLAQVTGRLETATAQLADMTAERDAAAENARRERDIGTGLYGALSYQTALVDRLTDAVDREANDIGGESSGSVLRLLGENLSDVTAALKVAHGHEKPRCRVVTSPRFYNDVAREVATDALWLHLRPSGIGGRQRCRVMVDEVAEALGMRRAQA